MHISTDFSGTCISEVLSKGVVNSWVGGRRWHSAGGRGHRSPCILFTSSDFSDCGALTSEPAEPRTSSNNGAVEGVTFDLLLDGVLARPPQGLCLSTGGPPGQGPVWWPCQADPQRSRSGSLLQDQGCRVWGERGRERVLWVFSRFPGH